MPPGEKRFGEQCQISWAYSKKVASTNEIISHYKALPIQLYVFFLSTGVSRTSFRWEGGGGGGMEGEHLSPLVTHKSGVPYQF